MPEVGQNYLIELVSDGVSDQMKVKVEIKDEFFVEGHARPARLAEAHRQEPVQRDPDHPSRGAVPVRLPSPRAEGKAVRVVDLRDKE